MGSMLEGGAVGGHWMHVRFVETLLAASHHRDLAEAAQECEIDRVDTLDHPIHCHLCNTRIHHHVVLTNNVNDNHLFIGGDCYDKLLLLLEEGKVRSALPKRDEQTRSLRDYWKKCLKKLDETVLGWFLDELNGKRLPSPIAPIVYTIQRLGFAPTTDDADKVVAYYKATRRFDRRLLVSDHDLSLFRRRHWLPVTITIDDAIRIRELIEKDRQIILSLQRIKNEHEWRERATKVIEEARKDIAGFLVKVEEMYSLAVQSGVISEAEAREMIDEASRCLGEVFPENQEYSSDADVLQARNQAVQVLNDCLKRAQWAVELWKQIRRQAIEQFDWYRGLIEGATKKGVRTAVKARTPLEEPFFQQVSPLLPEKLVASEPEMTSRIAEALRLGKEWLNGYRSLLVSPQKVISVREAKNYILVKRDNEWVRLAVAERYHMPGVISETGVYDALVLTHWKTHKVAVLLISHKVEASRRSVLELSFENKRHHMKGGRYRRIAYYSATHKGREVVPDNFFTALGIRLVYIAPRGKQFKAWLLD